MFECGGERRGVLLLLGLAALTVPALEFLRLAALLLAVTLRSAAGDERAKGTLNIRRTYSCSSVFGTGAAWTT